jgi:hypothetical protein
MRQAVTARLAYCYVFQITSIVSQTGVPLRPTRASGLQLTVYDRA